MKRRSLLTTALILVGAAVIPSAAMAETAPKPIDPSPEDEDRWRIKMQILAGYLGTSEGRTKLFRAFETPAAMKIDWARRWKDYNQQDPRDPRNTGYLSLADGLQWATALLGRFDGTEEYDLSKWEPVRAEMERFIDEPGMKERRDREPMDELHLAEIFFIRFVNQTEDVQAQIRLARAFGRNFAGRTRNGERIQVNP